MDDEHSGIGPYDLTRYAKITEVSVQCKFLFLSRSFIPKYR
jgi:hypothetical protein